MQVMKTFLRRLSVVLRQPDGIAEAIGLSALIVAASLSFFADGQSSSFTTLAAALLVVWGLLVASVKPAMATGMMLMVCISTFLISEEVSGLVTVGLFLVVEVLFANSRWNSGTVLAAAVTLGFALTNDWVLGLAGLLIALSVALIRRQLILLEEHQRAQVELELTQEKNELARRLHDHLANSLTRVVLLAEQPFPDSTAIAQEARHSVESLHEIMRQLRGFEPAPEEQLPLTDVIEENLASLQDLGYDITADINTPPGATITPSVADAIREMFINTMKHGASPVRLIAETDLTQGRILLVNGVPAHEKIGGTGSGVASIEATAHDTGGSFSLEIGENSARALLEFPAVRTGGSQ